MLYIYKYNYDAGQPFKRVYIQSKRYADGGYPYKKKLFRLRGHSAASLIKKEGTPPALTKETETNAARQLSIHITEHCRF
jgi:hypothetical protein